MQFMKVVLLSTLISISSGCILDGLDSADSIKEKFNQSILDKNYGEAVDYAKRLSDKEPKKFESFFILAQAYAQADDKTASISALSTAIKLGLNDAHKINNDPLLAPIKSSAGFNELMEEKFGDKNDEMESVETIMKEQEAKVDAMMSDTTTSITDKDGKTVIKAGDIEIDVNNEQEKNNE